MFDGLCLMTHSFGETDEIDSLFDPSQHKLDIWYANIIINNDIISNAKVDIFVIANV